MHTRLLLYTTVFLSGCNTSLRVPEGADITCVESDICPSPLICDFEILRCVQPGVATDRTLDLTVVRVEPAVAARGASVQVEISSPNGLNTCRGGFGGVAAVCTVEGPTLQTCVCDAIVSPFTPEGEVIFEVEAVAGRLGGATSTSITVDKLGPVIDPTLVFLRRSPMGQLDELDFDANPISEPPPAYPTQGVALVRVWPSDVATQPLDERTVTSGLMPIPVGTLTDAPATVWLSAVDVAGNEGERVAVERGRDDEGPVIDALLTNLSILQPESRRTLEGDPAAALDAESAIARFEFFEGGTATGTPAATADARADGGFDEVELLGIDQVRPLVVAIDKVGNRSEATAPRAVFARLTAEGRAPGDTFLPRVSARPYAWPEANTPLYVFLRPEPPITPGVPLMLSNELSAGDYALLAQDDGNTLDLQTDEQTALPQGWTSPGDMAGSNLGGSFAYDLNRHTAVAFGGIDVADDFVLTLMNLDQLATAAIQNRTQELPPAPATDWQVVSPVQSPPPLIYASMAHDTTRRRTVLFGGLTTAVAEGCEVGLCNATWEYDGTTWTRIETAHAPFPRAAAAMAFDPLADRVILFGGISSEANCGEAASTANYCSDTWAYDGTDWTPIDANEPPAGRGYATMTYDPWTQRMLAWGGIDRISDHFCGGTAAPRCDDTLAFNGTSWKVLDTGAPPAAAVLADDAVVIPAYAALGLNLYTRDLLAYDFFPQRVCAGETREPFSWACIAASNMGESALSYQFIGFDPLREGVLMRWDQLDNFPGRWATYQERSAEQRAQALLLSLELERTARLTSVEITVDATASSPSGAGHTFQLWNFGGRSWAPPAPALDVTSIGIEPSILDADSLGVQNGKAFAILSAQPTQNANATPSTLSVDYAEIEVTYTIQAP